MKEEAADTVAVLWLSYLLSRLCNSVSFPSVVRPTTVKLSVNSTVILLGCLAKPSFVFSVYSSGQSVQPWEVPCVDCCVDRQLYIVSSWDLFFR